MIVTYIQRLGWLVGLMLLQALVLNNIRVFGYATPFLYVYVVLKMESDVSRDALMLWGFVLGLGIDIFSDTPGMNAAATTLLAFLRPTLLRAFTPRDLDAFVPSIKSIGFSSFMKYTVVCVLVHHLTLLSLELFSFVSWERLLLRIGACALFTIICVLSLEGIRK
ncbi:MAG: rod shape-determining protein MreD [Mediterranea sp.]|jgi:rod shape-determining protein MreD|nr:rod shape-determining protein MreD [Mediterranea sp.]